MYPDLLLLISLPISLSQASQTTSAYTVKMSDISNLPPEILREILSYLPISSLLSFGETCGYHHALQGISLNRLKLGVFPTRYNGLISLVESTSDLDTTHNVQIILRRRKTRTKSTVIFNQNLTISRILHKYGRSLQHLEMALWDVKPPMAESLLKCHNLQSLSIRLDHSNTRWADLGRSFWCESPGSTVWNYFYARPGDEPVFGRLKSLNLERSGITDYQLLMILHENPAISKLRLQKCLTLTDDFFRQLSRSEATLRLNSLHFENSDNPTINTRLLKYIECFGSLRSLSFAGCTNLSNTSIRDLNDTVWRIPWLALPYSEISPDAFIEIDPAYA